MRATVVDMGFFLALEGGEGAGKSTILNYIKDYISEHNGIYESTREPGGTIFGEKMRELLITKDENESLCAMSELLLMYASRAQLVEQKIKPWLKQNKIVLTDRFFLSSLAYQGGGRGFNIDKILNLHQLAIDNLKPKLTLLLDVDIKIGMNRVNTRAYKDRFEQENYLFFERVRQSYLTYAHQNPQEIVIIDANLELAKVQTQVKQALDQYLLPFITQQQHI